MGTGFRRSVQLAALAAVLGLSVDASAAVRQVVVLQSFDRGQLALDYFTEQFHVDLDLLSPEPVTVVQFVVNPAGFVVTPEDAVVDFLRAAFANRPRPDLIVTVGGPAAAFARKYRSQLFSDAPLLFAAVDERYLRSAPLSDRETAVPVVNDFPRIVDDILALFPRTREIFVIMSAASGKFWRPELQREFQRFGDRVRFTYFDGVALPEILRRVAALPPDSVIFYHSYGTDAQGGAYGDERIFTELRSATSAPLFATQSVYIGLGIVGGTLMSIDNLGRRTAEVALRLLNGEPAGNIRVPAQVSGPPLFDARELRRRGISESRLPPQSVIRFRPPSLWRDYPVEVALVLAGLLLQSALIFTLLYQRRARQRAEHESRRNLALAADTGRRVMMSTLTGSIAHELTQPLNSILHNAQAAELMMSSDRGSPGLFREVLTDIHAAVVRASQIIERHRTMLKARQLERRPTDIHTVVRESIALVQHETKTRRVQVDVNLPSDPCVVAGDQVLLQQVFVNLVMNAAEAMTGLSPDRRRITVHTTTDHTTATICVRDSGPGLPAQVDGQLFEPFVTTKTNGLGIGLAIAHSIIEAHRGHLDARNNADGGATFSVTLPRDQTEPHDHH